MRLALRTIRRARIAAIISLAVFSATCTEAPTPVDPDPAPGFAEPPLPHEPATGGPASLDPSIGCRASVVAESVSCGASATANAEDGPSYVVLGGQAEFVGLTSSNVSYDSEAEEFSFDVTVSNLIAQAIGTSDGTAVAGIRIFFETAPTVTAGSGTISVQADGTGVFTGSGQPYYAYHEILAPSATSATNRWTLSVPATATEFAFTVYVDAPVEHPDGWIELTAAADTLELGDADRLTTSVTSAAFDVLGRSLGAPELTSSAPGVATVNPATGVVTGLSRGTTTITASANGGALSESLQVEVLQTPVTATLAATDTDLTADGVSTAAVTLTLLDGLDNPVPHADDDITLSVTGINDNTPGATLSALTNEGDGTYTATLTSPVNNGTGDLEVRNADNELLGTLALSYSGGNNIPVANDSIAATLEDTRIGVTLSGIDSDGDPLTYHLIRQEFGFDSNGAVRSHFEDADGNAYSGDPNVEPIDVVVNDPTVYFEPSFNDYADGNAYLYYTVSDGQSTTNEVRLQMNVGPVDDAPVPGVQGDLFLYEDVPLEFEMGGVDDEMDRFKVLIQSPPSTGFLYQYWLSDELTVSNPGALAGESDTASRWPMRYEPPSDYHDAGTGFYGAFQYLLEQSFGDNLASDPVWVTFQVYAVNDAPEIAVDGFGSAQTHDLSATVIEGGTYSLPTLAVTDADSLDSSNEQFAVTIENSGEGTIDVDTDFYSAWGGIVFTTTPNSISFQMAPSVPAGIITLTLDDALNSLRYTAGSSGDDTLTITVDDLGNWGSCTPGEPSAEDGTPPSTDPSPPCAKQAVTTVALDVVAGTPPAEATVMTLTETTP